MKMLQNVTICSDLAICCQSLALAKDVSRSTYTGSIEAEQSMHSVQCKNTDKVRMTDILTSQIERYGPYTDRIRAVLSAAETQTVK